MRASLDTNVIIHFYKANLQNILFDFFDEGVFIYEQIRNVELENHGQDVISKVDSDIAAGRIEIYTNQKLKDLQVYKIFEHNVNENRNLYGSGDLGEVYAISLAQTLGAYSLVTDDTKQGGPYMSLLQFEDDIMPFTFADVLILRYLMGVVDEKILILLIIHQILTGHLEVRLRNSLNDLLKILIEMKIPNGFVNCLKRMSLA